MKSKLLAPVLVAVAALLTAANWMLTPERAPVWAATVGFLGLMVVALFWAWRRPAGDSIRSAVVFAGGILMFTLAGRLAVPLGGAEQAEWGRRAAMATLGGFYVFTGNLMPKTLTPLASQKCDPARAQALNRFMGWTWVLTGLGYALCWIFLPMAAAETVSLIVLLSGTALVAARVLPLFRKRMREV